MRKTLTIMIILSVTCFLSLAQNKPIKGKITDAQTGESLIGVMVYSKAENKGTTTDIDGNYTLSLPVGAQVTASYIGYSPMTVKFDGQSQINFALQVDALTASDVVVIGYGGQKRSTLSTSISNVKIGGEIKSQPVSMFNALQGQIPGVTITGNGGDPLSGVNIVIRGQGSRQGDPVLFVVDGVPGAPYNEQDVENVTVLKDAAAAAIYGANVGSGGVVIITTKKAKAGKVIISAKAQYGLQNVAKKPSMLTAQEYNMVRRDAAIISGVAIPAALDPNNPYYSYGNVTRTNWVDEIFRTGSTQNYAVSLSGGNDRLRGGVSVEYNRVEGTMLNTWADKMGFIASLDFTPYKWLTVSERLSYSVTNGQGGLNNNGHTGVLSTAMFYPRSATVYEYDINGNPLFDQKGNQLFGGTVPLWAKDMGVAGSYGEIQNPVATLKRLNQQRPNSTLYSTTTLQAKPIEGLTIKSDFTANWNVGRYEDFSARRPEIGKPDLKNSRTISTNFDNGWLWETVASYERYFEKHHLSAMVGGSLKYNRWSGNSTTVYNFPDEGSLNQDFINGTNWTDTKPTEYMTEEATSGLFARLAYNYGDRYFFTGSIRRDASSKLYHKNNSGVFPAFSVAWKISSESFMASQNVFSMLKLRGSWGRIGNVNSVNNYSYLSALSSTGGYIYLGDQAQTPIKGLGLSTIPNLDLKWETSEQTDIGVDMAFFGDRLTFTADYYIKNTRDMIEQLPIPSVAGLLTAPLGNIGLVQNRGWEFQIGFGDQTKSGFSYFVSANASIMKNEVKDLGQRDFYAHGNTVRAMQPLRSAVGESWYSYYLIPTAGIFQSNKEVEAHVDKNGKKIQPNAMAGDLKFVDVNADGIISDADRQFMGSYIPPITFGATANLAYKGFDLSLQIQGVAGNKIFNGVKVMTYAPGQGWNMSSDVLDSWGYNKNSSIPLLSMSDKNGNTSTVSDFFLEDGSYARLKNITVGYTLPSKWFSATGKNPVNMRVYFSAENVATLTKYSGLDPEVGYNGLDGGTYPASRIFSFGININL